MKTPKMIQEPIERATVIAVLALVLAGAALIVAIVASQSGTGLVTDISKMAA